MSDRIWNCKVLIGVLFAGNRVAGECRHNFTVETTTVAPMGTVERQVRTGSVTEYTCIVQAMLCHPYSKIGAFWIIASIFFN